MLLKLGFVVRAFEEPKRVRRKKNTREYNFTYLPTAAPFAAATVICIRGWVADVSNHANFS